MIDSETLRYGWTNLCGDLIHHYQGVMLWHDDATGVKSYNQLAPLCASALTIGCGGRGSEPQRMNTASLHAGVSYFVLDDKLTEGPKSGRILPHTSITHAALKILCSARGFIAKKLGLLEWGATDSLFATIETDPSNSLHEAQPGYRWASIEASALTALATQYFSEDLNFQRELWVTTLGERLVDRWLIRALTGHGSHLLNAFSPSMNVAPAEAMGELREILEHSYPTVLGDEGQLHTLANTIFSPCLPLLPLNLSPDWKPDIEGEHVSADPLPPLDRQCLIDWNLVASVRADLARASINASLDVQATLSMLCHSGLPSASLALELTINVNGIRHVGQTNGVAWKRQHYVHDIWIPIQKPTIALLQRRGLAPIGPRTAIVADAARWLRSVPGFYSWPEDDFECLQRFATACERWRRIELPPSICTMASPRIETACLSPLSLSRLATIDTSAPGDIGLLAKKYACQNVILDKNHSLTELTSELNKWASDKSLGGQLARAQGLKKDLEALGTHSSAIFNFGRKYLELECDEIIDRLPTKGKLSTLATRWTALHPVLDAFERNIDPEDFADEDLLKFIELVNKHCLARMQASDNQFITGTGKLRSGRAQDALQRLFNVLHRDGWDIPPEAWESLGGAVVRNPRLSASSSLFFPGNLDDIARAAAVLFRDEPHLTQRLIVKSRSMAVVPMRIGEASCLPMRCVTATGALVICKTPFAVDKSDRTSRIAQLTPHDANMLNDLTEATLKVDSIGKWLYRFDDQSSADDQRVTHALADLIRWSTGDPQARVHSLRAQAYMNLMWPGWQDYLRSFLQGEQDAYKCEAWLHLAPMSQRWTQCISAMAAAGHGAVDPGFRHYASVWPLIYSIYLQSTLCTSQPASEWIAHLGHKPNTLSQAKRRSNPGQFDRWKAISTKVPLPFSRPFYEPLVHSNAPIRLFEESVEDGNERFELDKAAALKYVCLRSLELTPSRAGHLTGVAGQLREQLERHLPNQVDVTRARERKKSTQLGAALQADVGYVLEDFLISSWVISLADHTRQDLSSLLLRNGDSLSGGSAQVRLVAFWKEIVANIPASVCFRARFGRGHHLTSEEESALRKLEPSLKLDDRHRDLGAMPQVMLAFRVDLNAVSARRITSLLKTQLLAFKSVQSVEAERARDAGAYQTKRQSGAKTSLSKKGIANA